MRCLIQEPCRQSGRNLFRRNTFSRAGSGASANGIGRRDRGGIGRLIRQPTDRDGSVHGPSLGIAFRYPLDAAPRGSDTRGHEPGLRGGFRGEL